MDKRKYHLSCALKINPVYPKALEEWNKNYGQYTASSMQQDIRNFVVNGNTVIRPAKRGRYTADWQHREFAIFWYSDAEMFLLEEEYPEFRRYFQLFLDHHLDSIQHLFTVNKETLLSTLGITNSEHADIILERIEKFVIREHEEFSHWLTQILIKQDECQVFLKGFANNNVYSLASFYRNILSERKLLSLAGSRFAPQSTKLWHSFQMKMRSKFETSADDHDKEINTL